MNLPIKLLNRIVGIVVLTMLTGCVPIPHTTERSPEVRGRVLDAHTHLPIKGAKVYLIHNPHHTTYTYLNGYFRMKGTRNFHWAYVPPEGHWPDPKDDAMGISHTNFVPHGFMPDWSHEDIGNLLLEPKKPQQ